MTRKKDPPGTAKECRDCEALVFWAKTSTGKFMPLDVSPSPKGDFYCWKQTEHILALNVKSRENKCVDARLDPSRNKYTCHFETCPSRK